MMAIPIYSRQSWLSALPQEDTGKDQCTANQHGSVDWFTQQDNRCEQTDQRNDIDIMCCDNGTKLPLGTVPHQEAEH